MRCAFGELPLRQTVFSHDHQAESPTQGMAAAVQAQSTMADNPVWKAIKPFVNGGLSGMGATCIIQPIDMVKVRLQLGATGGPVS